MTDDKRFKQTYVCGDYGLIDYEKPKDEQWIDLHCMSKNGYENVQICINKMNELADENEQLKNENNKWIVEYNGLNTEYQWLKEENKQLKEALRNELHDNGNAYYINLFDELFNLNYSEWDKNEPYRECIDWEKILKEKGELEWLKASMN